jgi:hypothetical protein
MLSIQQDAIASHRSVPSITNTHASSPFRSRDSRPNSVHGGASPTRDKTVRIGHIVKYRRNTFTPKHARAHIHTCTHYRCLSQICAVSYLHRDGDMNTNTLLACTHTHSLTHTHLEMERDAEGNCEAVLPPTSSLTSTSFLLQPLLPSLLTYLNICL